MTPAHEKYPKTIACPLTGIKVKVHSWHEEAEFKRTTLLAVVAALVSLLILLFNRGQW